MKKNGLHIKINPQKLLKLKHLLENSMMPTTFPILSNKTDKHIEKLSESIDLSKDFLLYLSLIQKPINLLFSIDQFIFEFSKKSYQQKKTGEFFQQLKERKKLSLFYGQLTRKQITNLFNKVNRNKGYFSKNVFSLLERRLDIVLYRSGMTKTVAEAQQLIKHKKIQVNQNLVNIPSFLLNPGDIISMLPETVDVVSNRLLKSLKTKPLKNHPKIFGDFYSKLKKTKENEKLINSTKFQSKEICNLFIQLISTKIKLRSFLNLKKNLEKVSNQNSSEFYQIASEKTILTMLKWKSFFSSNLVFGTKKEKKFNQKQFFFKPNNDEFIYANQGCLQKKPLFWDRTTIKKNPSLFVNNINSTSLSRDHKKLRISNSKKKSLALYRSSFLVFLRYLENYSKFNDLLTLNVKKSLFKKPLCDFSKNLSFRVIKPVHLEISYNLLNVIYLYSPQRLNFPFFIDLDLIKRSLR